MENTGRIGSYIEDEIQNILYYTAEPEKLLDELDITSRINKAHVLMLSEQNCISHETAIKLLKAIRQMEELRYSDVLGSPMPRGLYLSYETKLIERVGIDVGGLLQYGRSRNDLKATILLMQLRQPLHRVILQLVSFAHMILSKADEYKYVLMPAYTHYQPAVPITYGHYLMGFAWAILRNINHMLSLFRDIQECPLGAGAVGGTSVPINVERTASLLGFNQGVKNSVDAVASRDYVLRILSELCVIDCNITRICEDMLLWTSSDFGFIDMPDSMVGGSSMMPNKRNVFLLENIRGRSACSYGAFVSALSAMSGSPYTNSISTGTEAVKFVWEPLSRSVDTVFLMERIIENGKPNEKKMLERIESGYTLATEQANYVVSKTNHSFRDAHNIIGGMIRRSEEYGESFVENFYDWSTKEIGHIPEKSIMSISQSFLEVENYGGGPGLESFSKQYCIADQRLLKYKHELDIIYQQFIKADAILRSAVSNFLSGSEENG